MKLNDNIDNIKGHKRQPCEIWSRCVGYYRPISNYNKGKLAEFNDRKMFKVQ